MKRLVLLGGGHAHLHVLRELARRPPADVHLMLVSPYESQTYSGMVPGLLAGHYIAAQCAVPLAPLAAAAGMQFLRSAAVALDAGQRTVTLLDHRQVQYDLLSIDTGPVMDRGAIPGARQHALFVRPIEPFIEHIDDLVSLAALRALDIVVVGGGAGGFELAMALQFRLKGSGGPRSRVCLVTGGGAPLAGYAHGVRRRALAALKALGITVFDAGCVEITARHAVLDQGMRLACDCAVMATGVSAPAWPVDSGLALDEQGFIAINSRLQSTSHPEVFAAGDVATRVDKPYPKSGVYAVRAGPLLADNLLRALSGRRLRPYRPQRRSLRLQGHWAWRWKDRIDQVFVAQYRIDDPPGGDTVPAAAGPPEPTNGR
jgi:pyridine nucleotide-disulfide oxidoreductase family protein